MTVKEIQQHRTYPWQVRNANSDVLHKMPPQVAITPAKYPGSLGGGFVSSSDSRGEGQMLGIDQPVETILDYALILMGPAPAPLLKAETFYRHQIMLRARAMSKLSQTLANILPTVTLPEDVTLSLDIDPVNLTWESRHGKCRTYESG